MYKAKKPQLMVSQKLSAIEDYLEGRGSYQEVAEAYNVSHVTILNWVTQKDSLIAECIECARMYPEALNLSIASEGESPTKLSNEKQLELLKENRRLKIEDSRKKDHIAYLESLLELNNIDPTKISKKKEKAIRYAKEIKHRTNIKSLCSFADLSRAAYYKSQQKSAYNKLNDRIINYIKEVQKETCYGVGYRPMTAMINSTLHVQVNKKRVHRIMDENNLLSAVRRKKYSTEHYKRRKELKANKPKDLLKRNFFCGTPRNHFVVDITYLFGLEKMYYLNTIVDLFNREIVAWKISEHPDSQLCIDTLLELSECCNLQGSIIHSDGGSSYDNKAYMAKVNELGMTPSMSFADCYDNSAEESVNAIIKTECLYNRFGKTKFKNRRIRCAKVLERIEEYIPFYNTKRRKSGLGWETPVEHLEHNPRGTLPVVVEQLLTTNSHVIK